MQDMKGARPPGKTELVPRWRFEAGDYVVAAKLSRDGSKCAVGTGAGTLLVLDAENGRPRARVDAHADGVLDLDFSPDGEFLASCGHDEAARIWGSAGEHVRDLPGGAAWVEHLAWAPTGQRLATASGRKVRIWARDGAPTVEAEPLPSIATGIAWRGDGSRIAAACYGGVHIWPVSAGAKARLLEWKGSLISLAWSPDGNVIACGTQDNSVHFWRLATGQDSEMRGYPFKPKSLAWDAQSTLLATTGDATVTVWDFGGGGPEGSRPIQLESHQGVCTRLAFSPKKGLLASGSQDASVLLWEPRRGAKPVRHALLEDEVTALAWQPDDRGLLAADAGGRVLFWEVR